MAIAGSTDPRMPLSRLERQVANLRAAGANVEFQSLDADHFLILTRAPEWTHRVYLMGTSLPGSSEGIGWP